MAEFQEVCKQIERMCKMHNDCSGCLLSESGSALICKNWAIAHSEKVESLVMTWAMEHPARTYKSEFTKAYPKCNFELIQKELCPKEIFGFGPYATDGVRVTCDKNCDLCWNSEIKDEMRG